MRECPKNKQDSSNGGKKAQSSLVSPPDRAAPTEATSGVCRGKNLLYSLNNRQEHENSPHVVTAMIQVIEITIYALLEP